MMRIPLAWLAEYVQPLPEAPELTALLTDLGIEIEEVVDAPGGLGGQVLVAEITPNRGDCLSMVGIAREIAARTGATLRVPEPPDAGNCSELTSLLSVTIDDPQLCPRYTARLVRGVLAGPSPEWLQQRLLACGQRPIDVLVDVTNYVMFELGQPLHAFDARKLGPTIAVRRAHDGEKMATLDNVQRTLTSEQLVITNGSEPVALAGVMGGLESSVNQDTRDVVIESAHFLAPCIRRTARALGLESESSYRFARTVDPGGTVRAVNRCTQLLVELAGGEAVAGLIDVVPQAIEPAQITLRPGRTNTFVGLDLTPQEMVKLLTALGLQAEVVGEEIKVVVPTYRPDLTREVDLMEEIVRLHGYNDVPMTTPPAARRTARLSPRQHLERRIRSLCLGVGLNEVWTFSLTSPETMALGGMELEQAPAGVVTLENALSADFSLLRWSLIPSMVEVVRRNAANHADVVRVFEVGRSYYGLDPRVTDATAEAAGRVCSGGTATTLPLVCMERLTLAGAVSGRDLTSRWNVSPDQLTPDLSEVKGLIELILAEVGLRADCYAACDEPVFEPERAGAAWVGGRRVAIWGELCGTLVDRNDLRTPVVLFEVDLAYLLDEASSSRSYRPLPKFPAALRDLALVVPEGVSAGALEACIREAAELAAPETLAELGLFDVYRGRGLAEGTRSLAYSLVFRRPDRTLTDHEVDEVINCVIANAGAKCGAVLRS